ncbi:hypothetical protein D3C73_967430 [compost metagenome]
MALTGGHQEGRPTLAALAEMEIETGDDRACPQPIYQDGPDELFGRAAGKIAIERIFDHRMEPHRLQEPRLHRRRRDAENRLVRLEDGTRMRLEGQDQSRYTAFFRQLQRTFEHAAMTAMHAVEVADRDHSALQSLGQRILLFVAVKYGHGTGPDQAIRYCVTGQARSIKQVWASRISARRFRSSTMPAGWPRPSRR